MAGQISIDPLVCNSDIKLLQNKEKTTEIKTILDSFCMYISGDRLLS